MDDQNESLNERGNERPTERWGGPARVPERGYAEGGERTSEIRSDIEQARADMTETIDAIQEKLRPGHLVSQATDTVRNATMEKVKDMARSARDTFRGDARDSYGVIDRIRGNPIPAALAAASVAWIAFSGRGGRRPTSSAIYRSTRHDEPFVRETEISEYPDAGGRFRQTASTAQNGLQRLVRENPLAAAAMAAAMGATVGLALPETRRENELMGEARDSAVNRVQEAARGAAERVEDLAGEAARKMTGEE
jgi:hypothetical protein